LPAGASKWVSNQPFGMANSLHNSCSGGLKIMIKKIIEFELFDLVVQVIQTNQFESLSIVNLEKMYWKSTLLLKLMQ
jgi:hypothetical protein